MDRKLAKALIKFDVWAQNRPARRIRRRFASELIRLGLTRSDLAKATGRQIPAVDAWATGSQRPQSAETRAQLRQLGINDLWIWPDPQTPLQNGLTSLRALHVRVSPPARAA